MRKSGLTLFCRGWRKSRHQNREHQIRGVTKIETVFHFPEIFGQVLLGYPYMGAVDLALHPGSEALDGVGMNRPAHIFFLGVIN